MNSIQIKKYIPRAIYYLSPWVALRSFFLVLLNKNLSTSDAEITKFQDHLNKIFYDTSLQLVSHARIGLYLILKYLNLPTDSAVILSPISLPEMLKMIRINKLEAQFVGYKKNSFELDLASLTVSKNARVFLYTPISGIHTDIDELVAFCKKHNLILVQDLTQSLGGSWKNKGLHLYSDYSYFSLCDLKTIHTHRGGGVSSKDTGFISFVEEQKSSFFLLPSKKYFLSFIFEDFISSALLRRNVFHYLGRHILNFLNNLSPQLIENLTSGSGIQIGPFHLFKSFMASGNDWLQDEIPNEQKYLYTKMQAQIGLERLSKFHKIEELRKQKILLFYKNLSAASQKLVPTYPQDSGHVFWRAPLVIKDYDAFQKYLLKHHIDAARSNLPWLPDLIEQSTTGKEMRENCIYLPIHYYLSDDEVLAMATVVNSYTAYFIK